MKNHSKLFEKNNNSLGNLFITTPAIKLSNLFTRGNELEIDVYNTRGKVHFLSPPSLPLNCGDNKKNNIYHKRISSVHLTLQRFQCPIAHANIGSTLL